MNAFKTWRKSSGLTQWQAAAQLGVTQSAIHYWENCKSERLPLKATKFLFEIGWIALDKSVEAVVPEQEEQET